MDEKQIPQLIIAIQSLLESTIKGFENRIERLERHTEENRLSHERIFNRIEPVEKENAVNKYQFSQIMDTLKELKDDIKEFKAKPAKHLNLIISTILSGGIMGVLGFILSRVLI